MFRLLALSTLLVAQLRAGCASSLGNGMDMNFDPRNSELVELVERLLKARLEEQQSAHSDRLDRLETLADQQAETISSQARQLRSQTEALSRLDSRLRSQDARMSYQAGLLRAQAETLRRQQDSMGQLKAALTRRQEGAVAGSRDLTVTKGSHNVTAGGQEAGSGEGHVTSQSHVLEARADDAGPLEGVVNQVSQQVTELGADLQSFRTQAASDLEAFRTQTASELQTLRDASSQQDQHIQDARTSTFVHWGSSQCGGSSQLVYSGVVGGSLYTQPGAATNYLCLTMNPVFSEDNTHTSYAHLYGGEYETVDEHYQKDPVCAVCRSSHSTTIMIPATNVCTQGWQLQYSGFLMAGNDGNTAGSEFICVDSALESRISSDTNENGVLLHYTSTRCGSLPCEPYVNDRIVTCVVCSL